MVPTGPRNLTAGGIAVASRRSVPAPPVSRPAHRPAAAERELAHLDHRVVAPTPGVRDLVAGGEALGAGLDDLADGEDLIHRVVEREGVEVPLRATLAQAQPHAGIHRGEGVADEDLALARVGEVDLRHAEVSRLHCPARVLDELDLAGLHASVRSSRQEASGPAPADVTATFAALT